MSGYGAAVSGQRLQNYEQEDQKKKADAMQQSTAPHVQALQALRTQQAMLLDPNKTDPATGMHLPAKGKEQEYNALMDQMQMQIHSIRDIMHPPQEGQPGALANFKQHLTDRMHMTNSLTRVNKENEKQTKGENQDRQQTQTFAQGATPPAPDKMTQDIESMKRNGASPQQIEEYKKETWNKIQTTAENKPETENWQDHDLILSDGRTISAQKNTKTGQWKDQANNPISVEMMAGAKVAPKTAPKGLKFDAATGQVLDQNTNRRFNPGDPNNPPEVAAMFRGAGEMDRKKQEFQLKMAGMRGASYNDTKPLDVYDSANGNAPGYASFGEIKKNPGRYVPVGPGAKAIASENLMQDIQGTSKLTRHAITNLKEDFPEDMKIKIAAAMRADDPHASLDQLIASGSLGSLSGDQQDFLIATRQLAENAMAMRGILGAGTGSEDMRDAIRQTLPGLLSPDKSFATRQLDAFDATVTRLHRGVPRVKLNEGGAETPAQPHTGSATDPMGILK